MKKILFSFLFFVLGCSQNVKINKDIQITIKYAEAYEIDLTSGIYTVFYETKPAAKIKFKLSRNEKDDLVKQYYDLKLNLLPLKSDFTNKCDPSASGIVILFIKDNNKSHDIKIGSNCRSSFFSEISNIDNFIKLIDKTIRSKPEIRNAPKSDIFYVD